MAKQIAYTNKNRDIFGGILLDDGNVVCACDGKVIPKDRLGGDDSEFRIIGIFCDWVDLSDEILKTRINQNDPCTGCAYLNVSCVGEGCGKVEEEIKERLNKYYDGGQDGC